MKYYLTAICWFFLALVFMPSYSADKENTALIPNWTPENMMPVSRVIDLSLSPQGTSLAYAIKQYQKIDDRWQQAKLIEIASIKNKETIQLPLKNEAVWKPKYSPNGKWLAFLATQKSTISADNKPASVSIKLWSLEQKKVHTLQEVTGDITDYAWSPNAESIAYILNDTTDSSKNNPKPIVVSLPQHKNELHIIQINHKNLNQSVDKKLISQAQGDDFTYLANFSWSPDGQSIAFCHDIGSGNDVWNLGKITLLHLPALKRTAIEMPGMIMQQPMYSRDGRYLAFTATPVPRWFPKFCIYVYDVKRMKSKEVACSFDQAPKLIGWTEKNHSIIFQENYHTWQNIYRLPVFSLNKTDRQPEKINKSDALITAADITASGEIALVRQDSKQAEEVYVTTLSAFNPKQITHLNDHFTERAKSLGRTERIVFSGVNNLKVEGLLTYPVNYQKNKKYPLVIELHGGPASVFQNRFIARASVFPIAAFSEQGYFYFRPNVRGSSGYGGAFREANYQDWGGGDYQDVISGIDYLRAQHLIDDKRVAIIGWSYGGYLAAWSISQHPQFKAAIIGAGITDLVSYSLTNDLSGDFLPRNLGGFFWQKPKLYQSRSPIYHGDKINTPTLFMYGDKDIRVPLSQGLELYNMLRLRKIPATMLIYPNQSHSLSNPQFILHASEANLQWINHYI